MSAARSFKDRVVWLSAFALPVVLAFVAVFASSAEAKRNKSNMGPAGLNFYKPPKKKVAKGHGKLIWQRNAQPAVRLEAAKQTKVLLYSSRSLDGKPIAVSGSVSIPRGKKPRGGWPVVTYAHGTTGSADQCAPSRNRKNGPATDFIDYINPGLNTLLKKGYAIVRTDYEGLGTRGVHPFMVGESEGRGVLDIVRAARQLKKGLLSKKYVIAGHSQGGHAALFAAGLAETWTPELKLRGTISYAPASHLAEQIDLAPALTSPSSLSAIAVLVLQGASTVSDKVDPAEVLTDETFALYSDTYSKCLGKLAEADSLGGLAPSTLIRSGADTTSLREVLSEQNPDVQTQAPIFLAQGSDDTTTFPFLTDQLADELIASGNNLDYRLYPGANHGGVLEDSEADALEFLGSHLPSKLSGN